jgi:putative transposase
MNDTVATEDQEQLASVHERKARYRDWDPGRRNSSRPAEISSASLEAGHKTAADQIVQNEKVLAMRSSTYGRLRHQGKNGRAELRYDRIRRRWHMAITVKTTPTPQREPQKIAAIDLGVRITASLSIEGVGQALHFDGRELLKDFDALGRQIALEQNALAGTRGDTDETRAPHSRAVSLLYRKRTQRLEHGLKTMAKAIAEHCADNDIDLVYVGWPKGILRDVKYGSSLWAGRTHNFWSFAKTIAILKSALAEVEIQCIEVGERGSSSTCHDCGSPNVSRHPRWRLTCRDCGETIHADQTGSRNIAKFQKPSIRWAGAEAAPRTATHRWSRHLWALRSANPKWRANAPEFPQAACA